VDETIVCGPLRYSFDPLDIAQHAFPIGTNNDEQALILLQIFDP
jgi:hypothetical protein